LPLTQPALLWLHPVLRGAMTSLPDVLSPLQISSVSVAAIFTVLSGQVSTLGWMFREDIYSAVNPGPSM